IRQLKRQVDRYQTEIDSLAEQISENNQQVRVLKDNGLYKEVKDFQAIYSDEDQAVIEKRRRTLQFKIEGIEQSYGKIVAEYEQAERDIKREQDTMDRLVRDHDDIDVEMTFPVGGERLLERTRKD